MIGFRLKPEDRAALEEMAREMGLPLSEVLRASMTLAAIAWRKDKTRITDAAEKYATAISEVVKGVSAQDTNAPAR